MADSNPFSHEKADDSAGFLLWKITALWQKKLAEVLSEFNISQTQYAIMASLKWLEQHQEATTQASIANFARIDKMTLSKSIRKLEAAGMIKRIPSTEDSRSVNVKFTLAGYKVIEKAIVAIETADELFFSTLSPKEQDQYKSLTQKVITAS